MIRTTLAAAAATPALAADTPSTWADRKATQLAQRAAQARQASKRRRRIDPATCERDYSPAEIEFMRAIQDYKATSGRMFPTWSEVLEVVEGLGYRKAGPRDPRALND